MSPAMLLWSCLALSLLTALARAQGSQPQNFFPASIPLAIRHPYMSVWQRATNTSGPLSNSWPYFWGQQSIMGWAGKIRIDGQTYAWMGNDGVSDGPANVTNIQITPTRTIYEMQAGPMSLTITFLSPIEPSDWVRQSMPFAYVSLEANSLDGNAHTVQVYSDISAEWVSGNRSSSVSWSSQTTSSSRYHEIVLQDADVQEFVEHNNQAQDGKGYYAMPLSADLTWQIDRDTPTRTLFRTQGSLSNVASTAFAPISPTFSVYAFAINLGQIQSTTTPVTWSVGILRDPTVSYTTPSGGTEQRRPFYTTQYSSIGDVIDAVTGDFDGALERAVALDDLILSNATGISSQYADLVSLATRQTMGSLDFTVLGTSSGSPDTSDVKIFMKDIGTSGRVNPVERMFAAFPMYMYLNASIARGLLRPLLEWQEGLTDQLFASQDLGLTYPQATGTHGGDSTQGLEQTGNMLIMLYAHARFSGDGSLLRQHYNTTKRWATYLTNNSLTPRNQNSADNENNANMTNLALKGIIGVKAMAEISRAVGETFDAQQFDSSASALIGSWQSLAVASDNRHILGTYGSQQSSALMYNIYADLLLGTRLIPQSILDLQTQFYSTQLPTAPQFGLPIDSTSGTGGSAAWTLLTSATVSDTGVRNSLIQGVWSRTSFNQTSTFAAFYDTYDVSTGVGHGGYAGPALGAMYSHLALSVPNRTIDVTGTNTGSDNGTGGDGSTSSQSDVGPIVGGVLGGLAVVGLAVGAFFYFRRKKRMMHEYHNDKVDIFEGTVPPAAVAPYYYHNPATGSIHGSDYVVVPNSDGSLPHTTRGRGGADAAAEYGMAGLSLGRESPAQASQTTVFPASDMVTAGRPSKARELARNNRYYAPESVSGSSASGGAQSASSRDPLSPGASGSVVSGAGTGTVSPTDVVGLRNEVENLRRVMQEIRAERFEPPPEYGS